MAEPSKVDKAIIAALWDGTLRIHSNPDLIIEAFKDALREHGCVVIHEVERQRPEWSIGDEQERLPPASGVDTTRLRRLRRAISVIA